MYNDYRKGCKQFWSPNSTQPCSWPKVANSMLPFKYSKHWGAELMATTAHV